MKKQIVFLVLFLVLAAPCQEQIKLAVLEPEGKGLSKDEVWMLSLVQSSIAADFNKYSSITIIDRQNLEAIIAEQKRSLSAITSDKDAIAIGNLANASHILTGKITKTPKTFMLELAITDVETGKRQASYSPKGITPSQVEDLSALKAASADLLKQLGVSLTEDQLTELRGPVAVAQVQAQTALAHGVVAERQGTSVAALSYFYQAAAFDPTLVEAVKRSSVMSANISGINIGDNIRNDIAWRKKWVDVLKETEETFYKIINNADPPYTLYYSTVIETKNINYQKETADLSISINLLANAEWFTALQRSLDAAQAVMDGLNATGRKKDWGLNNWPEQGVNIETFRWPYNGGKWEEWKASDTSPFAAAKYQARHCRYSYGCPYDYRYNSRHYDIPVEFELVNQKGKVIGKNTIRVNPSFSIEKNFIVKFNASTSGILIFNAVNANNISDNLTIRIASVNGKPPKTAKFPIIALKRTTFTDFRDGRKYKAVEIGTQTWMTENLNFNAEGSKCLDNDEKNCNIYGRLYDWETAMKICTVGWHLPSNNEWKSLKIFASGGSYNGKELKATSSWKDDFGKGRDTYGFTALPGGYSEPGSKYNPGDHFSSVGYEGYWWSSSKYDNSDNAYGLRIKYNDADLGGFYNQSGNSSLFSVRCVKD